MQGSGEDKCVPPQEASKNRKAFARVIILEPSAAQKTVICRLDLTKTLPDLWEIQIQGEGPRVAEVRRAIEAHAAASGKTPIGPEAATQFQLKGWAEMLEVLRSKGFVVEPLPEADHQFSMTVDLSSGRFLSSADALHEFAGSSAALTRGMADAIAKVFTEPVTTLARRVQEALSQGNVNDAVSAIKEARDKGTLAYPPSPALLKALSSIDVANLDQKDRRSVREARLVVSGQLRSWDTTGVEADALLAEYKNDLTAEQIVDLRLASATSALKRGHTESGLVTINELLGAEGHLPAAKRGWCWRNVSLALEPNEPEARAAARHSADAFLQAGDKKEAAKSLVRLSDCLVFGKPEDAIRALDEMFALAAKEGLDDRDLGSAAKHIRAIRLAELGRHSEAFDDAMTAVELRRGINGLETQLANSLYLASIQKQKLGQEDEADRLEAEADALSQSNPDPQHRFALEVTELFSNFERAKADDLSKRAKAADAIEIVASVNIAIAELDPMLDDSARIGLLEGTLDDLDAADAPDRAKEPARFALAMRLENSGHRGRAEGWYRTILAANPNSFQVRDRLIQCLWNQKKWGQAAELLSYEIDRFGKSPGLLFALGKSLVEAGDFTKAVPLLTDTMALAEEPGLKDLAREMRERALDAGGTVPPHRPELAPTNPVTYEELESVLADFSKFISADKRMAFWINENYEHKWVPNPERRGKDFLHIFLKARLRDRIDVFEEIGAGAGRIDLYLKFGNGLAAVVELKMCGKGYSSTYAASGEEQIIHYLENRDTSHGYLVVFDARVNDFGKALLKAPATGKFTIGERFVDLRPEVKQKPSSPKKDSDESV
jgi:tetratricopeptide (TPR) repeat protein